eukprot:5563363-Amphidinium_carterae.1
MPLGDVLPMQRSFCLASSHEKSPPSAMHGAFVCALPFPLPVRPQQLANVHLQWRSKTAHRCLRTDLRCYPWRTSYQQPAPSA